jgi:hypothetical protein
MIYPQVSCEEWSKLYNIRVIEGSCPKCKADIVANIPFAMKGYRGLKSEDHGCGEKYTKKVLVPHSEEEKDFWKGIANSL